MDANTVTIYIELLDEGTQVARPTQGVLIQDQVYRVLPTPHYNPDEENWEFPPGSIVRCARVKRDDSEILLACELLDHMTP